LEGLSSVFTPYTLHACASSSSSSALAPEAPQPLRLIVRMHVLQTMQVFLQTSIIKSVLLGVQSIFFGCTLAFRWGNFREASHLQQSTHALLTSVSSRLVNK
jgi:hypothetical protein